MQTLLGLLTLSLEAWHKSFAQIPQSRVSVCMRIFKVEVVKGLLLADHMLKHTRPNDNLLSKAIMITILQGFSRLASSL